MSKKVEPGADGGGERRPELGAPAGLCAGCRHAQRLTSARAAYLRCRLAETDPRYPRYPRLPVLACGGYRPSG